eukprot:CAMPEP_0185156190 /NCGR_PEP_ID=MMETSP1139-20130426/935_1 /TAXON_ID=298111 /ORGANISM="Pavlova sp., Strain CCMP459" /LENGTH=73 /DNA_ID=CAMNT_0027721151 /DNA_START=369 /DNA_END=590 /DNA_ORIENTATION=+
MARAACFMPPPLPMDCMISFFLRSAAWRLVMSSSSLAAWREKWRCSLASACDVRAASVTSLMASAHSSLMASF